MPTNYKYIDHESKMKRGGSARSFKALLLLILVLVVLIYASFFILTRKADAQIQSAQYTAAEKTLNPWKWLPLVNGAVYEKLGTARFLDQGSSAAAPDFDKAKTKFFFKPVPYWRQVLRTVWMSGRYSDGLFYTNHIEATVNDPKIIHFYKAGFYTGQNQLPQASSELKTAGAIPEFSKEISLLKNEIDQRSTTGQYAYLFDRENLPLVNTNAKGEMTVIAENLAPVLRNPNYDFLASVQKKNPNPASLTIDYRIQNAALKALGKYAGAIVLLDIKKGDILAAASSLKGVGSDHPKGSAIALNEAYEPGSIIKMITLAGAIENGVDFNKIFPLKCEGFLKLPDNKILYDWMVHGDVANYTVATAVSCNVAFARIGLALKPADLFANLKQFGFNSRLRDSLPLALGKIVDADINDEYIARLSIGLDHLRMTPLHGALLAAAIGNQGVAQAPRLLLNFRNVIGIPFNPQPVVEYQKFMNPQTAQILVKAMTDVVTHPEGTGRRAVITNFPFAMKTGTAGEGAKAYNAILIGFGPLPNPRIAFSIFLEHAGKAEWEGARVTKLFLESIQAYI
jgi:penicillin-binding protein A